MSYDPGQHATGVVFDEILPPWCEGSERGRYRSVAVPSVDYADCEKHCDMEWGVTLPDGTRVHEEYEGEATLEEQGVDVITAAEIRRLGATR